MRKNKFPSGWDEERIRRVLAHYESQTEEQAVAEDEPAKFWRLIEERSAQKTLSRDELERRIKRKK